VVSVLDQLEAIPDPELPFLTIKDLGILRGHFLYAPVAHVQITPTYSGCPALDSIREDIEQVLRDNGFTDIKVETVLSPPWTTDWMTERGREALQANGIAPPGPVLIPLGGLSGSQGAGARSGPDNSRVTCPQCGSLDTAELSRFGSTACKGMWRCRSCLEPFDHFKAH